MQRKPEIMCFAGPNGSGKSTITKMLLPYVAGKYINADEIQVSTYCSSLEAAQEAERLREQALENNEEFLWENPFWTVEQINQLL
ncbi:MAG: hypothetical protein ACI4EQ_10725 [Lachnospiraceae bacterium]